MAVTIPPGGNWKNIPHSIPSKRLEQIRISYKNGGGSRSTYYGRLLPNNPSYTISTNFHRPGNGCHLHYDYKGGQHRVISQREAARLQSFPDDFIFYGNKSSINKQIGNAVPPLLAYQIAIKFPFRGKFIDLFSGAGGLSLGFMWAGWEPIVANDIDLSFLETYRRNVHKNIVEGDIRDKKIFDEITRQVTEVRLRDPGTPIIILGGPPCQGFSTAGNKRSMSDERNQLFYEYKKMILAIKPMAFIFENVTGLTNMEGGKVFDMVKSELKTTVEKLTHWILHAEQYGVPQRRTRLFLIGTSTNLTIDMPSPITYFGIQEPLLAQLKPATTVEQAISDLPRITSGEDGSRKSYASEPKSNYQMLMRVKITPAEFINSKVTIISD
jgi:DNA (cytosine-5)-methyltransferase 1